MGHGHAAGEAERLARKVTDLVSGTVTRVQALSLRYGRIRPAPGCLKCRQTFLRTTSRGPGPIPTIRPTQRFLALCRPTRRSRARMRGMSRPVRLSPVPTSSTRQAGVCLRSHLQNCRPRRARQPSEQNGSPQADLAGKSSREAWRPRVTPRRGDRTIGSATVGTPRALPCRRDAFAAVSPRCAPWPVEPAQASRNLENCLSDSER